MNRLLALWLLTGEGDSLKGRNLYISQYLSLNIFKFVVEEQQKFIEENMARKKLSL